MHPENLVRGDFIRIEDVSLYLATDDGAGFNRYGEQIHKARMLLEHYGGLPLNVVAVQYPFLFVKMPNDCGHVMLDLRFSSVGKVDGAFRRHYEAAMNSPATLPDRPIVDKPKRTKPVQQIVQIIVPGAGEPVVRQIDAP